jgi:drug/metabolite transporter (DMT)-like permease
MVATTGSLVPAVIVVLARVILHERLKRIQYLGGATALLGVVLVSAW